MKTELIVALIAGGVALVSAGFSYSECGSLRSQRTGD